MRCHSASRRQPHWQQTSAHATLQHSCMHQQICRQPRRYASRELTPRQLNTGFCLKPAICPLPAIDDFVTIIHPGTSSASALGAKPLGSDSCRCAGTVPPLTITVIAADLCVRSRVASLSSSQSWHINRQTNSETYQFALHSVVYGLHTSFGPLLSLLRLSVRGGRGETWQLECRSSRKQCRRFHAEQADADASRCTQYV